jgi:DNA-binding CsgD family transcriptional regulator
MDHHNTSTMTADADMLTAQRAKSGLLVFTPKLELIHMNEEASVLSTYINQTQTTHVVTGILPQEILAFCGEIIQRLTNHRDFKEWEHFELRRVIDGVEFPVLLRGFGLPDPGSHQPRVLIIMERVSLRNKFRVEPSMSRYHLTEREEEVLEELAKGFTNKEIANKLGITENTVKEHIKRLMQKMNTTTRTGLLSRMLHAASE